MFASFHAMKLLYFSRNKSGALCNKPDTQESQHTFHRNSNHKPVKHDSSCRFIDIFRENTMRALLMTPLMALTAEAEAPILMATEKLLSMAHGLPFEMLSRFHF